MSMPSFAWPLDIGETTPKRIDELDAVVAAYAKACAEQAVVDGNAYADQIAATLTAALAGKAASSHTHSLSDVTGLQAALDGKAAVSHSHTSAAISDFTEAAQDAVAALLGVTGGTVTYDDAANTLTIAIPPDGTDPEIVRDVLGAALIGVGNVSVSYDDPANTITISTTATVNATDAALRDRSTHTGTQAISTITGLQGALDGKAAATHAHAQSDITGLAVTLAAKADAVPFLPPNVAVENIPRTWLTVNSSVTTNGTLRAWAGMRLRAGTTYVGLRLVQSGTAAVGITQCWANIMTPGRVVLASSADQGATTFSGTKDFMFVTPYTPSTDEIVWIGLCITATTHPSLALAGNTAAATGSGSAQQISGPSSTGLTAPLAVGATAAALGVATTGTLAAIPYTALLTA